jgi:uncharacterized protein YbjT (DUF2867 family)
VIERLTDGQPVPIVLTTGAAGNFGSRLARRLLSEPVNLRLMTHRSPSPGDLTGNVSLDAVESDLSQPQTLIAALKGVD